MRPTSIFLIIQLSNSRRGDIFFRFWCFLQILRRKEEERKYITQKSYSVLNGPVTP